MYHCDDCKASVEVVELDTIQPLAEHLLPSCPHCGGINVTEIDSDVDKAILRAEHTFRTARQIKALQRLATEIEEGKRDGQTPSDG